MSHMSHLLCDLAVNDVAHEDLQPDNIMIDSFSLSLEIIDFGLPTHVIPGGELLDPI